LTTDGTPVSGTLTPGDPSDYYAVQVPAGDSLRLSLDSTSSTARTELYASLGTVPTRMWYDQKAASGGPDQDLVLTGTANGGVYYILVYGVSLSANTPYKVLAGAAPVFVTSISSDSGGIGGDVTVLINGAGFPDGPVDVRLVADGQPDIVGVNGSTVDSNAI